MIVYVDVLIVLNFIVDYLLLVISARLCGGGISRPRLVLAALAGAISSLAIFLPPLPPAATAALKLGLSAVLTAIAGGYGEWRGYLKRFFMLLATSFVFAGFMLFVTLLGGGKTGFFYNGICYFPISGIKLLLGAAAIYLGMLFWQKSFRRGMVGRERYRVCLSSGGKVAKLIGEVDSQNHLIDLFSGTPVAVGSRALLEPILPEAVRSALAEDYAASSRAGGIRMIPCKTIAGEELLPAFRPERMVLENGDERIEIEDVYIAVAAKLDGAGTGKLLLNPALTGHRVQKSTRGGA